MPNYIVNTNAQSNGDNEVHVSPKQSHNCNYPASQNRESLGYHETCVSAVQEAKRRGYKKANGCFWCARPCHTT